MERVFDEATTRRTSAAGPGNAAESYYCVVVARTN